MFLNISSRVNISSFWTNIMLDCYRSCFDVLWNNWMTNALAYFLEWTIFASHTEVTARGWTLAGWCRVLSSQCTSIHLMIHQCHLDLFVKCSHRMRSNIILQWYGTSVILNTSLTNNTIRWWSSYTITVTEQDYISLYQRYVRISLICTDVINKWSLSTNIVPVYIYFNIPGCYYFSSVFAHRLEDHRPTESSAVG